MAEVSTHPEYENRKVNEALVQGVETARAVLTTTPQGQAVDAQFVRWLGEPEGGGVFSIVAGLVDEFSDNEGAEGAAQHRNPIQLARAHFCAIL